ncbi:RasGEF domain containing protein [Histomonas meleagridis]|uniref:RasGEF domain containing protein n=1 Tax=Histomonas meleagridis TaxID=135588 RepID=UPI0035595B3B|nr:RasGEF domain containing protein [Histomonas meleagridis]KAH0804323.1 RasGEF domain containing protein [Histomonas meleagridis]
MSTKNGEEGKKSTQKAGKIPETKFSGTSGIPQLAIPQGGQPPLNSSQALPKTKFSNQSGLPTNITFNTKGTPLNQNRGGQAGTLQLPSALQKSRETNPKGGNFFTLMSLQPTSVMSLNPFSTNKERQTKSAVHGTKKHHRRKTRRKGDAQSMPHSALIQSLNPFSNTSSGSDTDTDNPLSFSIINPSANRVVLFYTILDIPNETREELKLINTIVFQDPNEYTGNANSPNAATFNQLILFLTEPEYSTVDFQKLFLITFPSFATPPKVLAAIFTRYFVDISTPNCNIKDENQLKQIRIIIIRIISAWLRLTPYQFTSDMMNALDEFIKYLSTDPSCKNQVKILTTELRILKGESNNTCTTNSENPPPPIESPDKPKQITDVNPVELARQVSILHSKIFHKIGPMELLTAIWGQKKGGGSANLDALTDHFDKFSRYVQLTIIQGNDAKARAKMFNYWVETAIAFKEQANNYHGIFAVICGLTHRSVQRLKDTIKIAMKNMGRSMKKQYEELVDLCDFQNDFHNYRPALSKAPERSIPFIGCLQRDLIYVQEGYPNEINGLINFQKCTACYTLIKQIDKFQNERVQFKELDYIQDLIKNSFPELPDTMGMMKLSMEKEKKK